MAAAEVADADGQILVWVAGGSPDAVAREVAALKTERVRTVLTCGAGAGVGRLRYGLGMCLTNSQLARIGNWSS